jgi:hypothetical protein
MGVTSPKAWAIGFIDTLMTPNTWNGPFDLFTIRKASNKACFFPPFKMVSFEWFILNGGKNNIPISLSKNMRFSQREKLREKK